MPEDRFVRALRLINDAEEDLSPDEDRRHRPGAGRRRRLVRHSALRSLLSWAHRAHRLRPCPALRPRAP
jgi:hypothetical protein